MSRQPLVETADVSYRTAVVAADVMAAPGTVTCTKQAGGAATAGAYNVKVVAGNVYGRTTATAGNIAITTETTNLTVRAAFAAVSGATFYDIYCSTDSDPKFVGRITEAQRASGILLTAVNVTGAGGTAGAVDIQVPGTGSQAATTAAVNTAYVMPSGVNAINCNLYQYVDFDITASKTGDSAAITLIVMPFVMNTRTNNFMMAAAPVTFTFGGVTATYQPLTQRLQVEVRAATSVHLLVVSISGTGASIDIDAVLS